MNTKPLRHVKSFTQYVNENYSAIATPAQPVAAPAEPTNEFLFNKKPVDASAAQKVVDDKLAKVQEANPNVKAISFGMRADNDQASSAKTFATKEEFAQAIAQKGVDKGEFKQVPLGNGRIRIDFLTKGSLISKIAAGSSAMTVGENLDTEAEVQAELTNTEEVDEGVVDFVKKGVDAVKKAVNTDPTAALAAINAKVAEEKQKGGEKIAITFLTRGSSDKLSQGTKYGSDINKFAQVVANKGLEKGKFEVQSYAGGANIWFVYPSSGTANAISGSMSV